MNVVRGRGNHRQVIELPHGSLVALAAKQDNAAYNNNLRVMCALLGVPEARGRF